MNNTKKVMCSILVELKKDNSWTFDQMLSIQETEGNLKLTRNQLNMILNHDANGVSIGVIDDLLFSLGYTTEVVLGIRYD